MVVWRAPASASRWIDGYFSAGVEWNDEKDASGAKI